MCSFYALPISLFFWALIPRFRLISDVKKIQHTTKPMEILPVIFENDLVYMSVTSFRITTRMGCRRDVPERETANTNINPRILLYCVDIENKMAFKRQLLTLFPQYLFILMFKMQFKACFKFCHILGNKPRFKTRFNPLFKIPV